MKMGEEELKWVGELNMVDERLNAGQDRRG